MDLLSKKVLKLILYIRYIKSDGVREVSVFDLHLDSEPQKATLMPV